VIVSKARHVLTQAARQDHRSRATIYFITISGIRFVNPSSWAFYDVRTRAPCKEARDIRERCSSEKVRRRREPLGCLMIPASSKLDDTCVCYGYCWSATRSNSWALHGPFRQVLRMGGGKEGSRRSLFVWTASTRRYTTLNP
jgi:hypothetical protein